MQRINGPRWLDTWRSLKTSWTTTRSNTAWRTDRRDDDRVPRAQAGPPGRSHPAGARPRAFPPPATRQPFRFPGGACSDVRQSPRAIWFLDVVMNISVTQPILDAQFLRKTEQLTRAPKT